MPEYLRTLVVIIALALLFFWQSSNVTAQILPEEQQQHRQWRNAWLYITLIAFLGHNFWIFALLYVVFIYVRSKKENNPIAFYLILLLALPPITESVPGFGLINYFIDLSPPRLLALALLLPSVFVISRQSEIRFGKLTSDKFLLAFMLLSFALNIRGTTTTDAMRGLLYSIAEGILPYYVASRSLKQVGQFRKALYAYVLSTGVISVIALFEFLRHWLLYAPLAYALGADAAMGNYLGRADMLRAVSTTGQPIVQGYVAAIALGFFLYLQKFVKPGWDSRKVWLVLGGGLIAALSRGPWVGTAVMLVVFILTGPRAATNIMRLAVVSLIGLGLAAVLPGGEKIINLIPFLGHTEVGNITYRERLLDNAEIVIDRNFWLGSVNYLQTPEMLSMIQGQGIIDVVNSYLGVALANGVIGLTLFLGFFVSILLGLYRIVVRAGDKLSDEILLGRALLAAWAGIMVIIFTTSSISFISYIYWTVGGISVAYIQMMKKQKLQNARYENAYLA